MTAVRKKYARMDFRVSSEAKDTIAQAAALLGEDLSNFVMSRVLPEARRLIAEEHSIVLRNDAWEQFVSMMEKPPKASSRLKGAMRRHMKSQGA